MADPCIVGEPVLSETGSRDEYMIARSRLLHFTYLLAETSRLNYKGHVKR